MRALFLQGAVAAVCEVAAVAAVCGGAAVAAGAVAPVGDGTGQSNPSSAAT